MRRMRYKNPVHFFKRTTTLDTMNAFGSAKSGASFVTNAPFMTLATNAAAGAYYFSFGVAFQLNDLPDYNEFTSLFDRYKVLGVQMKVIPMSNVATANTPGAAYQGINGVLHTVTDYDDATTPGITETSVKLLQEYESYRVTSLARTRPIKKYIRPRIAANVYGNSGFGSYANLKNTWIDAASISVQHYGIKGIFELYQPSSVAASEIDFKVQFTYYIACKDLR